MTRGRLTRAGWVIKAAVIAAALLLFSATAPLVAQTLEFGISPAEIELVPAPGGTASGILVVSNRSARRVRFRVSLQDIYIRPGGAVDVLKPGSVPWSAVGLSRVAPAEFDLDAARSLPVHITVTVPPTVRGGRYAAIVVAPTPALQTSGPRGTVSVIVPKLAARLLVPVRGTGVVSGDIVTMLAVARLGGKGADIKVVFRNTGNVHVRTTGHVLIIDPAGQQVAKLELPDALVLPSSVREFKATWTTTAMAPGAYAVRAVVDYGGDVVVAGETALAWRRP